jgi:chromosome segregation ATPase
MQEFQNKLGSLTTRQQNQLTAFTGALSDFNSKWDTMLKIWTQRVQSYTTEMSLLKNDIQELQAQYNQSFFPKAVEDKKEKEIQG